MTDPEQPKQTEETENKPLKDLTEEELRALREKKIQERIAELRKRDPFIYR